VNQLSAGDPTWHRRRDNMWHFCNASPAKPHYAALSELLNAHADNLAAAIDQPTPDKPGKRHLSLGVTPTSCKLAKQWPTSLSIGQIKATPTSV